MRRFALDDGPPGLAASRKVAIGRDGRAVVRVTCPRAARVACRGTLTLADRRAPARALAKARYRIALGSTRRVALRLSRTAAARIRARRGSVRATTVERGASKKGPRSATRLIRIAR